MNRSLFEADDPPALAERLRPALRLWADRGVFFGTSSWKYEGWLGSIYSPSRFETRGAFSRRKFEAECLREYAETFPTVGGDFSFYQFPTVEFWSGLFGRVPAAFTFGLKAPEDVTVLRWPEHARYGPKAGTANSGFLDADLFARAFLGPLERHREQVAGIMFEFGTFAKAEFLGVGEFLPRLERFLDRLPRAWNYAVEIRNPEYLAPPYFAALSRRNVAHVFNAWTRMPTLGEQIAMGDSFTANFTMVRALLRRGCGYEKAVQQFAPYAEIREPDEATRLALREIAERSAKSRRRAYAFINNRLEGNAPGTIASVVSPA